MTTRALNSRRLDELEAAARATAEHVRTHDTLLLAHTEAIDTVLSSAQLLRRMGAALDAAEARLDAAETRMAQLESELALLKANPASPARH